MPATSSNKGLTVPTVSGDANVWGTELNASLTALDTILGGSLTLQSTASLNVTLSSSQCQYERIVVTGAATGTFNLTFPSTANQGGLGNYQVWNNTSTNSGVFGVICAASPGGGATCTVAQNTMRIVNVDGTNAQFADQISVPPVLNNYLSGLICSNDGVTPTVILDIGAGICADNTNTVYITNSNTAFKKNISSVWAAGSGNGGLGTGVTLVASATYFLFAIINGGSTDFYFDTSVLGANAPSGTTFKRRIFAFKTTSSSQLPTFIQNGDWVYINPVTEYSSTAGRAMAAITLTGVPLGIVVIPKLNAESNPKNTAQIQQFLAPVTQLTWFWQIIDVVGGGAGAGSGIVYTLVDGPATNTLGQIGYNIIVGGGGAASANILQTMGYLDRRGQDGGL